MKKKLQELKKEFSRALEKISNPEELERLEKDYLGRRKGRLTALMKELKKIPEKEVKTVGRLANETKKHLEQELKRAEEKLASGSRSDEPEDFDFTLPGREYPVGHLHLVTQAIREISAIFEKIGFQRRRYPEVEWDWYAFESLNMPPDHPARDEWETFFIDLKPAKKKLGQRVLTPHTSSGQIREMEKGRLPIRMTNISKCYRRQADASHTPMFHQFEGLVVDQGINLSHLKGTIDYFVKNFFGPERKIRLRPHHFQFTEPSFEVDVSCGVCAGRGCRLCKEGWLELAGAGLVHPNVLKAGKINPEKYQGFAFGWGVERCFLMKPGLNIDDGRLPYKNDLRFLKQF